MGVLCSKALELEKNENERNIGFPVDRRQTTKKTASGPAHRHPSWWENLALISVYGSILMDRGAKGSILKNRSFILFQAYFLNKCYFQPMHMLAHFRISTTNGQFHTWDLIYPRKEDMFKSKIE